MVFRGFLLDRRVIPFGKQKSTVKFTLFWGEKPILSQTIYFFSKTTYCISHTIFMEKLLIFSHTFYVFAIKFTVINTEIERDAKTKVEK